MKKISYMVVFILIGVVENLQAFEILEGYPKCGVVDLNATGNFTSMGFYPNSTEASAARDAINDSQDWMYETKYNDVSSFIGNVELDPGVWAVNGWRGKVPNTTIWYTYLFAWPVGTCADGTTPWLAEEPPADSDGDGIPDVADFYPNDAVEAFFKVTYKMWYGDEWGYMRVETSKGDSFIIKNPEWEGTVSQDGSGYIVVPPDGWDGTERREIVDGSWFGQSSFEDKLGFAADISGVIANPSESIISTPGISDGFTTGSMASGDSTSSGSTADSSSTSSGVSAGSGSTSSGSTSGTTAAQDGQIADSGDTDTVLLGKLTDNVAKSMDNQELILEEQRKSVDNLAAVAANQGVQTTELKNITNNTKTITDNQGVQTTELKNIVNNTAAIGQNQQQIGQGIDALIDQGEKGLINSYETNRLLGEVVEELRGQGVGEVGAGDQAVVDAIGNLQTEIDGNYPEYSDAIGDVIEPGEDDFQAITSDDLVGQGGVGEEDILEGKWNLYDMLVGLFDNNPISDALNGVTVSGSGQCSATVTLMGSPVELTMCGNEEALNMWGSIILMVSSVHAIVIIFRK